MISTMAWWVRTSSMGSLHMVAHQSHVPQNLTHLPGQMLSDFGLFSGVCWFCWPLSWTWVFWCCCVLVLLGFYFGLGHFSVVELWSCWPLFWTLAFQCRWVLVYSSRFPKKINTKQNAIFGLRCCCFWCYFLFLVFPFSSGMLHLGYAGFVSSSCWGKIEPCWVVAASFSAHVGPMWSHLGLCWDRVGSCC